MRIAILGGSFDPIHEGHLMIAKTALKQMQIDRVWFMPAKEAPLKEQQSASFRDRCNMVRLAIRPYAKMALCTLEGEREYRSYTIDTVKELQRRYPENTFVWLIGDDQAKQFQQWKAYEELLDRIAFYVFSRDEHSVLDACFHRIDMPLINVSSSMIRKGKELRYVCKHVRRYMGEHGLYVEEIVKHQMSEKRFLHSCSVAKLSMELAKAHHLDEKKAYLAGILHDVCKQFPYEKQKIWMTYHMANHLNEASAIWHGYLGAYYAKHTLFIQDKDIIKSIFHHVKGDCDNVYARIVYIADKLDPLRGYDVSEEIVISKQNLKLGYEIVKQQQEAYIKAEGVKNE